HRDEQHHPGTPAASLRPAAREEHTPAVEEHGGAEHRPYKVASGEAGERPPGQLHQHVAVEDDRNGENQAQPELAAEHCGMVAVPAMCVVAALCSVAPLGVVPCVIVHAWLLLHNSMPATLRCAHRHPSSVMLRSWRR